MSEVDWESARARHEPGPLAGAGWWSDLGAAMLSDQSSYSVGASVIRAIRMARVVAVAGVQRRLSVNRAYRAHVAAVSPGDRLFWLSHRHYLARGLSVRDRSAFALAHYEEVASRGAGYHAKVHGAGGLLLWQCEVKGIGYDIRLMPGNDVLYEGGLSLVLSVDGGRVCVVSFSWAPERLLLGNRESALLPFVTRRHLAADHGYQAAFHRAFERVTPAHLCLGALSGICSALGRPRMLGIAAERHPSMAPERREAFEAGYDGFWAGLGGERVGSLGWLVPLPARGKPLDGLDGARRRRALARRAHVEAVRLSAVDRFREAAEG